jgi:hypothetical protein
MDVHFPTRIGFMMFDESNGDLLRDWAVVQYEAADGLGAAAGVIGTSPGSPGRGPGRYMGGNLGSVVLEGVRSP